MDEKQVKDFIQKAVVAHHKWKDVLSRAIEDGQLPTQVEVIRMDNQCEFGKMLYDPQRFDEETRATEAYQTCVALHAHFHQQAARVGELAIKGEKVEARHLMAPGGDYAVATSQLVKHLLDWRIKTG